MVLEDEDLRAGIEKKHSKLNEIGWFLLGDADKVEKAMILDKDGSLLGLIGDRWRFFTQIAFGTVLGQATGS